MLDRLFDGLSVLVEQFEWCDGVSVATDIGEGIFDVHLAAALPDCITNGHEGEWEQDDHVE